jgi:predicted RNA-binding Zn-ribbon protein involved in translation (DUF1610 family)
MADLIVPLLVVVAVALLARWRRPRGTLTFGDDGRAFSGRGFYALPRRLRLREFRNVILADRRGTTEVDIIVVGNAGVFVVELKDYNAWIFGEEADEMWTARYSDGSTYQFQNPLRQNFRHVKVVQDQLGLSPEVVQSVVSFTGDCKFMKPMPPNVVRGSYRGLIEGAGGILLTDTQVHSICSSLEKREAASTAAACDGHVAQLNARFSSTTTCPKCGNALVIRHSRNAPANDAGFLACRGFPHCRYTRHIDAA